MDEDEFEQLYEKVIDVGIKYVARNYTDMELRAVIDGIMEFDS
jgi:helix-turn-helix protein